MALISLRELMTPDPTVCTPETAINEVARMMLEQDCGAIPVVTNTQDGCLAGIVTDRDLVVRLLARDKDPATCTVRDAMSENIAALGPDATLDECVRLMAEVQVRRVPVVDNVGRVVGMVSQADLARASADRPQLEEDLAEMVEEVSEPAGAPPA